MREEGLSLPLPLLLYGKPPKGKPLFTPLWRPCSTCTGKKRLKSMEL